MITIYRGTPEEKNKLAEEVSSYPNFPLPDNCIIACPTGPDGHFLAVSIV